MKKRNLLFVAIIVLAITRVNAQSYTGVLTHTNGYFIIKPYGASYDDGTYVKSFYDGNNRRLVYWNSGGGYTDMHFGNLFLNGKIGIGKLTPTAKLHVNGNIIAEEIKVQDVTEPTLCSPPITI